jgi:hypothetical protein
MTPTTNPSEQDYCTGLSPQAMTPIRRRGYPQRAAALSIGRPPIFIAFFAINAVLVAYCLRIVHRGPVKTDDTGGGA